MSQGASSIPLSFPELASADVESTLGPVVQALAVTGLCTEVVQGTRTVVAKAVQFIGTCLTCRTIGVVVATGDPSDEKKYKDNGCRKHGHSFCLGVKVERGKCFWDRMTESFY